MTLLLPFDDPTCLDVAHAGGKGANLASLTQAGFPVPPGAVVTSDAYRNFITSLRPIVERLRGIGASEHAKIQSISDEIGDGAKSLSVPKGLRDAIARLIGDGATTRWAVRSSGTAEDTAGAAFAGQHDTYLNCIGLANVVSQVRACWLSLWSPRAIAYRAQLRFDHLEVAMAVVIQEMVPSEVAGVAFSVNPVSGDMTQAVINANFGLGESVVSGEGEVDHIVVDKVSGRVVESRIATKSQRVVAAAGGVAGTVEAHVEGADAERPALTDAHISALTAMLLKIETHYGWPQDIEWGIVADRIYLLQSRPITTIPPRWTRDESAERFPNPITPFTWDFVEAGFHQSLNHSFALMGLPPYDGKWFASFNSYIYGNQNAVELYARRSPVSATSLDELQLALPSILERFRWVPGLPGEWHRELPAYLARLDAFMAEPIDRYDLPQCWDFIGRVNAAGTAYFLPNIAISIGHGVLHRALRTLLAMGTGSEADAERLTSVLVKCETMTTRVNAELHALAAMARGNAKVAGELRSRLSRDLLDVHATNGEPFWGALRAFLAEHGHRETDFDAYQPTWVEAPWVVLDHVRALLDAPVIDRGGGGELAPSQVETEQAVLAQTPQGLRDVAAAVIRLAREFTALDDLEHYHTTRLTLPMRRGVRALGERLVARDILTEPMDVFFGRKASLATAVAVDSPAAWKELAAEIREAKAVYAAAKASAPEWTLGVSSAPETSLNAKGVLSGIPGSPGVVEGLVYIVRGVEDFANVPNGAILVARTTNPAWTPLFYTAAGVVTESGGPLSHGAVTAREMKIPAVMSVRGVLTALANGDRVRVDGSAGRVTRLFLGVHPEPTP